MERRGSELPDMLAKRASWGSYGAVREENRGSARRWSAGRVEVGLLFSFCPQTSLRRTHDSRHGQASSTKRWPGVAVCRERRRGGAGAARPLEARSRWCGSKRCWEARGAARAGACRAGAGMWAVGGGRQAVGTLSVQCDALLLRRRVGGDDETFGGRATNVGDGGVFRVLAAERASSRGERSASPADCPTSVCRVQGQDTRSGTGLRAPAKHRRPKLFGGEAQEWKGQRTTR